MQWFRRAAGHGNIRAYADIAHAYAEGYGVKKNKNRAVQYYIMGAEKGDPEAQYWLGRAYQLGRGIKHDSARALYWLNRAADNGNTLAMDALTRIYNSGALDQPIDHELAARWAEKAIETRKQTGESDPDLVKRLRFFGVDVDRMKKPHE